MRVRGAYSSRHLVAECRVSIFIPHRDEVISFRVQPQGIIPFGSDVRGSNGIHLTLESWVIGHEVIGSNSCQWSWCNFPSVMRRYCCFLHGIADRILRMHLWWQYARVLSKLAAIARTSRTTPRMDLRYEIGAAIDRMFARRRLKSGWQWERVWKSTTGSPWLLRAP